MKPFSAILYKAFAATIIVTLALAALPGVGVTHASPLFDVLPSGLNGNGPGGVGTIDGSSTLELWLLANQGVFTDTTCTTAAANGNTVACWQDQSGNGRNYTQATAGNRPTYRTNIQNGQPVVDFDGANDRLTSGAVLAGGDDTFTYIATWRADVVADRVIFLQENNPLTNGGRASLIARSNGRYGFNGQFNDFDFVAAAPPYAANVYNFSTVLLNGTNTILIFDEGTQYTGTINIVLQNVGTTGGSAIGYSPTQGLYFDGNIPEIIVYTETLSSVNRILVENYLSSKYNVALTANDVYVGDTAGNGNFDLNVAGIGQLGGAQHTQSHAAGIIVVNNTFLNANGDWLLFGHNTATNATTTADLPVTGSWDSRWSRSWYVDVTDAGTTGGTVNIIFDYSDSGLGGTPTYPVGVYRLLSRAGTSGAFTDVTAASGATVAIVGDQIQFLGVNVSLLDGLVFTLGVGDITAPTLNSFTRMTLPTSPTNADALVFRATFSEAVQNVDAADFTVTGTTATITGVNPVSASVYEITVSGGDLAGLNGAVGLNLAGGQNITDLAGNALPTVEPAIDETYDVDNAAPIITINEPDTLPATSKTLTASASDGTLSMSNTTGAVCDGTLTFVPYADQTFTSEADNGTRVCYRAVDALGNTSYSLSNPIDGIDTTALTVTVEQASGQSDPTNVGPIRFTVTFNKSINISTFTAADVVLSASTAPGPLSASMIEVAPNDGTTFEVSVSGMSGNGDVIVSLAANTV